MVITFYTISAFINFLTSIILGTFVLLKNRKGQKNIAFFLMALFVGLWSLSYFFWQNITDDPVKALFWCRILSFFMIMIPATYLHFVLAITENLEKKYKLLSFTYLFFSFFAVLNSVGIFVAEVAPVMEFKYWPIATPYFSIWLFFYMICVIYSSYLLVKKYMSSVGVIRVQIKYIAIGMIFGFIFGSSNFIPWYKINIPPYGQAFVWVYILTMTYAITRYKLMNIRILAKNILFYLGVSFFLYLTFNGVALLYKIVFGDVFAPGAYFAGIFIAPLFAVVLYAGSNFLYFLFGKYLFPSMYVYQTAIKKASHNLSYCKSIDKAAEIVVETIKESIQPAGAAVLLKNETNSGFEIVKNSGISAQSLLALDYNIYAEYFKNNKDAISRDGMDELITEAKSKEEKVLLHKIENEMHEYGILVCAPLKSKEDLLGIIVADYKQYEPAYSQEDFDLLEMLSYDTQIVIENIILYQKMEKENVHFKNIPPVKKPQFIA